MEQFLLGCCYYPEQWAPEQMQSDLERIKDMGFNVVRMGEFAWSRYEPQEGAYNFSFLIDAVEAAGKLGIKVILGTPTAAPPIWLTNQYPETLAVNGDGVVMQHGSRQQHNYTSPVYLKYCAIITEKMVETFKVFDNVIGWQIDNEIHCHGDASFAPADDRAFQRWLKARYGTIEALNRAWGTVFWGMEYADFSEITCPKPTPTHKNPSLVMDFYLFTSDSVIDYVRVQSEIIRRLMPAAFITHNGWFDNIDYKKLTDECLDVLGFDSYPLFDEHYEKGGGRRRAYQLALTRGCSEKFLILEQQSGQPGQLCYMMAAPLPGQIRMWTYQSIANGANGVLYFRYRTALFGAEQLCWGIFGHDGEENQISAEIRQTAAELARVGDFLAGLKAQNQVAIFNDYTNACNLKTESFLQNDVWDVYMALNQRNIHADFVFGLEDVARYKVLVVPHLALANDKQCRQLRQFAEAGGIVLISARSGIKDFRNQYYPLKAPGVLRGLAQCSVDWLTTIPAYAEQGIRMQGKDYGISDYYESLILEGGECAARYTKGLCAGRPAISKCGNIYYIGFYARREQAEIYADLIQQYVPEEPLIGEMVETYVFDGYKLYLNHGDTAVQVCGYDLLTEQEVNVLPPYGAALMRG